MIKTFLSKRTGLSYGWLVVGTAALLMSGFWGSMGSFGVFLKPLIAEFGWTRAMTSGAMSTVQVVYGLVAVIMGRLTDKYGARVILACGAIAGGLGYLLLSHLHSIWQLYIFFGIFIGICLGTSWAPLNATVSKWFVKRRVLALSFITLGPATGNMILPPFLACIISSYGWSSAYSTLAILVCITAIPALIATGKKPPVPESFSGGNRNTVKTATEDGTTSHQRQWSTGEAIRSVPFWMLIIFTFINSIVFFFVSVHLVAYATDVGIAPTSAALIFTFLNGISIAGIFTAWPMSASLGNRGALLFFLGLQAVALFLFISADSLWMFLVLAMIFGFGFGGTNPLRAAMIPHLFGMKSVGAIMGLIAFSWALGGAIGPFLAAYIYDISQSYDIAFLSAALLVLVAMAAIYNLESRRRTH
jgi:OFA family oxalate/formate antiporter-like MFS transporter